MRRDHRTTARAPRTRRTPPRSRRRRSLVDPGGHPVAAEAGGEAQALRAHGKVGDEVPHEGDELHDRRDEGQDGAVKLRR